MIIRAKVWLFAAALLPVTSVDAAPPAAIAGGAERAVVFTRLVNGG